MPLWVRARVRARKLAQNKQITSAEKLEHVANQIKKISNKMK
jgi:hypothetical protein